MEATKELKSQSLSCPVQVPMGRAPGLPKPQCLTHPPDPSLTLKEMCSGRDCMLRPFMNALSLCSRTRGERLHWSHFTDENRGARECELSGLLSSPGQVAKQGPRPSSSALLLPTESKALCCSRFAGENMNELTLGGTLTTGKRHKQLHPSLPR